jgi:hypothetical protein
MVTSGPACLGRLRDDLLDQLLDLLKADPAVDGVALVGSFGRGDADNWSDIDLLILMDAPGVARFADQPAGWPWAQADLLTDGRHNSPAGATSVGTTHIRSGLPIWVDLHVHPATRTSWPADSRVLFERRPIETGTLSFDQLNASGPRQPATTKTASEIRRTYLGYVPIAGKYVGRRSPMACEMIRFIGHMPDFSDTDPAAQLLALRGIAANLSDPSWTSLSDAVTSYLDLVEATFQQLSRRHRRGAATGCRSGRAASGLPAGRTAGGGSGTFTDQHHGGHHRQHRRTTQILTTRRPRARRDPSLARSRAALSW